jgi:hypothetical protein
MKEPNLELGLVGEVRLKLNEWFSEPLGAPSVPDSTETELKKPYETFETSPFKAKRKGGRGRGDQREIPHKVEEFYVRGSAGRRESHGPQGSRKAVMPHKGSRPKYPK